MAMSRTYGRLAHIEESAPKIARFQQAGEILGIGMSGGMLQAKQGYEEALRMGANPDDAAMSFLFNFASGTTEIVPIAGWLRKIRPLKAGAASALTRPFINATEKVANGAKWGDIAFETIEEAGQEAFQKLAGNMTAKQFYDENRELMDGVIEGAVIGGLSGALFSSVVTAWSKKLERDGEKVDAELAERLKKTADNLTQLKETSELVKTTADQQTKTSAERNAEQRMKEPWNILSVDDQSTIQQALLGNEKAQQKEREEPKPKKCPSCAYMKPPKVSAAMKKSWSVTAGGRKPIWYSWSACESSAELNAPTAMKPAWPMLPARSGAAM
jgi:hypothetical protein